MRVGLIAEGPADLAVLVNVLKGTLGLDSDEHFQFIRPELRSDETDLHDRDPREFSNWELVRSECEDGRLIAEFLDSPIDEERLLVIHVDAAECDLPGYDVERPPADHPDSVGELRRRIVAAVDRWLGALAKDHVRHAVAVEETDAWVLALFSRTDTARLANVKQRLERHINESFGDRDRKRLFQLRAYQRYSDLSRPLRKRKVLLDAATRNESLHAFLDSLRTA